MVTRLICYATFAIATIYAQASVSQELVELDEEILSDFYGDELTVSIATGGQQKLSQAPAVASVITDRDIAKSGARNLDEVLERIPGLHVSRSVPYNPIYTFRGIYSDFNPQVLMLVNGVPLTNLYEGDRNQIWVGFPLEAVSRIEVIRGPGSALYGAEAFAGVINVITKKYSDIDAKNLGLRAGSNNTKDVWYLDKSDWNNAKVTYSVEYIKTDGDDGQIQSDSQSFIDNVLIPLIYGPGLETNASLAPNSVNVERELLDLRFGVELKDLNLNVAYSMREGQNYAGVAEALDSNNVFSSERWLVDFAYNVPVAAQDWEFEIKGSYFHTTQEIEKDLVLFPPGSTGPTPIPVLALLDPTNPANFIPSPTNPLYTYADGVIGNPEVYERHSRLSGTFEYGGIDDHDFTFGVGYYGGDVYKTRERKNFQFVNGLLVPLISPTGGLVDVSGDPSQVFLPEKSRENIFAFIQDIWHFSNDWEFTAGVRFDDYSDFGSTVNPRLALVWSTSNNLTTKVLYGSAFRAPSIAETSIASNPSFLGNPDLDPETLDSFELVFDYRPHPDLDMTLNFFRYTWDDIIQFLPDTLGFRAQNAGKQTGYGSEFEAVWRASRELELRGNAAYQHSEDDNTNTRAANAPALQLYLQAHWKPVDNWSINTQVNFVADRYRVGADTRDQVDDYVAVDLTARRENVIDGLDLAIIVTNLFDEDIREPSRFSNGVALIPGDLPQPGRSILGEIRYSF